VEPFETYKFGKSNSFLAYWLVYFALTIIDALIVMFMIPFQIYFIWNVGFFYILGACTLSENAKRAI
jgi:hypothetical protein